MSKECPNCSAPIQTESLKRIIKCVYCGQTIENPFYNPPQVQPQAPGQTQSAQQSQSIPFVRVVVPLFIFIALVSLGPLVYFSVTSDNVGGTVVSPVETVALGDFAKPRKAIYAPGEIVVVDYYNTPGNSSDWISLANKGQADNQYITYEYTGGKVAGAVQFDDALADGEYEIRVFFSGGYTLRGRSSFKVDSATARIPEYIKLSKELYAPNEEIVVNYFNVPANNSAWISLARAGTADNTYITYEYTDKQSQGKLGIKSSLTAGNYEVRIYFESGYTVRGRIPLTVK